MRKVFLFVLSLFLTNLAISQTASSELVGSSGDSFRNGNYQLDWSVGEIAIETHNSDDYIITQGFHQGISIISSIDNTPTDIKMSVYPNPTSNFVHLQINKEQFKEPTYTITDFSGKVMLKKLCSSDLEEIDFSSYAMGAYFVSVSENNKLIKTFKIIKN